MPYDYPPKLVDYVAEQWPSQAGRKPLPPLEMLTELFSACYQSSLLTEELQSVTFRAVLIDPEELDPSDGPPWGHHALRFDESRPLQPHTLGKMSPAADFTHTLLGLRLGESGFEIWGLVHSGSRWVDSRYSRRRPVEAIAGHLMLSVSAPGSMSISDGSKLVARLAGGRVSGPGAEVLTSHWLEEVFSGVRRELEDLHVSACESCPPVTIDSEITRTLSQSTLRRALDLLVKSRHGGCLLIVPPERAEELECPNPYLTLRYHFMAQEPRRRYRTLLMRVMRRLGEVFTAATRVTWTDYVACHDRILSELDEAIEEFSHLLSSLAAMDGAVLLTQRLEVLAFGAIIAGNLPPVEFVQVALDVEAHQTQTESTAGVGTRHRSAYRICSQLPWLLAIVQSQDGRIRLMKQHQQQVTCWDQLTVGAD